MVELLKDFPSGPLDYYRHLASFDWKRMKQALYGEEIIKFEKRVYKEFENYPELFKHYLETPALDDLRRMATRKMFIIKSLEDIFEIELNNSGEKQFAFNSVLFGLDMNASVKLLVGFRMFPSVIKRLGTERHKHFLEKLQNFEILGCYGLTEIGHGSNARNMRTTATYDTNTEQFILNSPDFQAAKCWVASLGKTVTHMVMFANLIIPDGLNHGLHAFVVPVRDTKTFYPFPGIKVFDMGEKAGLNGVDNGVIIFNNYGIPRQNLLNKLADVTKDGRYVAYIQNPNQRFALTLNELLGGRLFVSCGATSHLTRAITIAIRYAGVRRQFGAGTDGEEIPILEYQSHQCRLLPHLASAYAFNIFCSKMYTIFVNQIKEEKDPAVAAEIHAILSACKPLCTRSARDAIQECREACGGHGYLKAAKIGDIRGENDVLLTGEGDNRVLLRQTSKWLLKLWPLVIKKQVIVTPLESADFLNNSEKILHFKCSASSIEDTTNSKYILDTFQWLICYLLKTCYDEIHREDDNSVNNSREENLCIVYMQHFILLHMFKKISLINNPEIKIVLLKLFALYGTYNLLQQAQYLYAGRYATSPNTIIFIQNAIVRLSADLKNEAVALVDVIAPEDRIINSVLGYSDGQVYKHLEEAMLSAPAARERPSWWNEILNRKNAVRPKL